MVLGPKARTIEHCYGSIGSVNEWIFYSDKLEGSIH